MHDQNHILQLIKASVQITEPGATVVLYGSYARGDNKTNSDIDILILIDKDKITSRDAIRVAYPLYDIEFETGKIISPLILSRKSWETKHRITPFYKNVRKEGVVL
ncbi:MAG: nucleotidyltransferase domain-containing protein [Ginsengibacter sp.]